MSTLLSPASNGLLLPPAFDPWAGAGLLGLPARSTPKQAEPQSLRSFITEAYPRYGFHHCAEVLIELLQQVADGQLSRLIVTCPPRLGKSLLALMARSPARATALGSSTTPTRALVMPLLRRCAIS